MLEELSGIGDLISIAGNFSIKKSVGEDIKL